MSVISSKAGMWATWGELGGSFENPTWSKTVVEEIERALRKAAQEPDGSVLLCFDFGQLDNLPEPTELQAVPIPPAKHLREFIENGLIGDLSKEIAMLIWNRFVNVEQRDYMSIHLIPAELLERPEW